MRVITAGILGAGRIGKIHANNLMAMSGVRLKAIADPYVDFKEWPGLRSPPAGTPRTC